MAPLLSNALAAMRAARTPNDGANRWTVFVCRDCNNLLLGGEALRLSEVLEDTVQAWWSKRQPRHSVLAKLQAPYTPKKSSC
eukprot:3542475-Karenia_brevis.AAC.1